MYPVTPTSPSGHSPRHVKNVPITPPSARRSTKLMSDRRVSRVGDHSIPRSRCSDTETPTRSRMPSSSRRLSNTDTLTRALQGQGNAMNVYIRVRPYSEREISQNMSTHSTVRIDSDNPKMITLLEPSRDFRPLATYSFARCFWSVFSTSSDVTENQSMSFMRDAVDTYVNNAAINSTRIRPRPLSSLAPYQGAGSNATMVDGGVTHPPYANQADIFEYVGRPILANVLEGYNGCVFAYGQTGSGKTFTMMGFAPSLGDGKRRRGSHATTADTSQVLSGSTTPRYLASFVSQNDFSEERPISPVSLGLVGEADDGLEDVVNKTGMDRNDVQGIIPRIAAELFSGLRSKREKDASCSYRVEVSYYEIYNERVFDLIKPQRNSELKIRHNRTTGPYVEGLTSKIVSQEEDIARVLRKGIQERHTAQTMFNDRSSRSHSILSFSVVQLFLDTSDGTCKMQSKLNLVDLAGSERAGAAGVDRPEYEEGVKINLSLTVLGRVIDCLADLSQNKSLSVPVPYRDSNLTWLLMDSIGGNSQTSMIATISPHMINYDEMRQTIRYSSRAKSILNRAVRNEDPQTALIRKLQSEVERLLQLSHQAGGHEFTREYVLELEERCRQLQKNCRDQEDALCNLRVEMEHAGMNGLTRRKASVGLYSATDSVMMSGSAGRQATVALQQQLLATPNENDHLERELLDRTEIAANEVTQKEAEAELSAAHRQIDVLRCDRREMDALFTRFHSFQQPWTTEIIFRTLSDKMSAIFRECESMLYTRDRSMSMILNKGQISNLSALAGQKKKHESEMLALTERYQTAQDSADANYETKEAQSLKKYREAQSLLKRKLQLSVESCEKERQHMATERENLRRNYDALLAKAQLFQQSEIIRLRESITTSETDRQNVEVAMRQQQEEHEQEVKNLHEEIKRAQLRHDTELTHLRSAHVKDSTFHEAATRESDRQRWEVEQEVSQLRRDNLMLQSNYKIADSEYQERVKDLVQHQAALISVVHTFVTDWEQKSPTMDASLAKLREFICNPDCKVSRQKLKDAAFRSATSSEPDCGRKARLGTATAESAEDFRETVARMKRVQMNHKANMEKLQRDLYEGVSKVRGYQLPHDNVQENTENGRTVSHQVP